MSAPLVRAVLALGILVASVYFAVTTPARLGLDLKGGTQIVLETQDSPTVTANRESTDRAVEVLRRRVDALGVAEPSLTRSGDRRIIVELPGVQDPREAAEVIGRTAQLTFHAVLGIEAPTPAPTDGASPSPTDSASPTPSPSPTDAAGDDEIVIEDEDGQPLRLGQPALTGDGVDGAQASIDQLTAGGWFVTVDFKGSGRSSWEQLTGEAACAAPGDPTRRVAIVLDDQVISSPQVDPSVPCDVGITGGSTQITGSFTAEEARELAALIRGGALPVPVEVIEQRTVGPTLGAAAIDASAKAAVIGVALTALFIIAMYRLLGGIAVVALGGYALISYAALVALGATLTLPGLAGFVLAIGMAIDANVLVFERAREEYAAAPRKGLRTAVATGFAKAWSAIIDSNVTTLLAAGLLFFLASGPVRGFGVTLSIGVIASMVSALVVTRVIAEWAVSRKRRVRAAGGHRCRHGRPGPRVAHPAQPGPDHPPRPALARRLGDRAGARGGRHRRPRPEPRGRVHRRPPRRVRHEHARSTSRTRGRSSPTPGSRARSCRRAARTTSRSAPATSPTTRSSRSVACSRRRPAAR